MTPHFSHGFHLVIIVIIIFWFLDINRWNLRHGRRTNAKELYGKREKQWSPVKPRQQIAQ